MSERPDENTRQQRLDALRGLAREVNAASDEAVAAPQEPAAATSVRASVIAPPHVAARQGSRQSRRRGLALVGVAALIILAVVGAIVVRAGGFTRSAPPAPALTVRVVSLQATGAFSCPSTPVWSPDGKQFAVMALVGAASGCPGYDDVTNIQRSDNSGSNDSNTSDNGFGDNTPSGPTSDTYAIVTFDAANGHVARVIKLPELTSGILCLHGEPCGSIYGPAVNNVSPESLAWSPDGRTLAAFFTYFYANPDQIHSQERSVLIVTSADGGSAARILIARGRSETVTPANGFSIDSVWAPSRYTWDLSTGAATYTAIHYGQDPVTAPFAPGYHLGANGALTLDQRAQQGDVSPWSVGVFALYTPQGATAPVTSYQTSLWLWSADGRYVSPNVATGAYLNIPGVTAPPPATTPGLIGELTLAPPDAATTQALKAAAAAQSQAALARNPGGKLLASLSCARSGAGQLTIRSVATGKMLAQASYNYPLTSTSLGCAGDLSPIAWSPDGARIVASDGPDGQLIVWQVNVQG